MKATTLILSVLALTSSPGIAQGLRNYLITPLLITGDDLVAVGIDDEGRVYGSRYEIEYFDNPQAGGIWQKGWRWDMTAGIRFYSPTTSFTPQRRDWAEARWHGVEFLDVAPDGTVLGAVTDSYMATEEETSGCPVYNIEQVRLDPTLSSPTRLPYSNTPATALSPFDLRRYSFSRIMPDRKTIGTASGGNAELVNAPPLPTDPCELRWRYTGPRDFDLVQVTPGVGLSTMEYPPGIVSGGVTAGNSRGSRVGYGFTAASPLAARGCVWTGLGAQLLSSLTGHEGIPLAINTLGEIAGIELTGGATIDDVRGRLFLYLPLAAYGLSSGHHYLTPEGQEVRFIGMNDRGGILYRELGTGGETRLWTSGNLRTFSSLWTSTTWSDIEPQFLNRRGWIVSVGTRISDGSQDYVLQRPWLELSVTFAKTELLLCEETEMTATLTSVLTSDLTGVNLVTPVQFAGEPALEIVSGPVPSLPLTIPGGTVKELKWRVRAVREGETRAMMQFRGDVSGTALLSQRMTSEPVKVSRAVIVVNDTGDAGDYDTADGCCDTDRQKDGQQCSLRAAIQTANALAGEDVIHFDIPGGGVPLISPATALPKLEQGLTIDGTSQTSSWVEVSGASLGAKTPVLELAGGVKVKGLVLNGAAQGFGLLLKGGDNEVTGCRVGTNAAGTAPVPNRWGITVTSSNNRIGGGAEGAGNVISGNSEYGVGLERASGTAAVSGNIIAGNRIGTTADGMNALAQKVGVAILGGSANTIGGPGAAGNLVGGNTEIGIHIAGSQAQDNVVEGNLVGVKQDSSAAFGGDGFGSKNGIAVAVSASRNRIGGASPNIVCGCQTGIIIAELAFDNTVAGNRVGIVEDNSRAVPNLTGIWVLDGAANRVGGSGASGRNVVSGNKYFAIQVGAGERELPPGRGCAGTVVDGNWIGLDQHGTGAAPNGQTDFQNDGGVLLSYTANNTAVRNNVISGNRGFGVLVETAEAHNNAIRNNHIGLLPDGTTPLGNEAAGVALGLFTGGGRAHCAIGGVQPGEGNRIAFNGECGVYLAGARYTRTPTPVTGNVIYGSSKRAIALADVRPENDPGDGDTGPNDLQNYPRLRGAANLNGQTNVLVDLKSFAPTTPVRVEIFRHRTGDVSPAGEVLLGAAALLSGTDPQDQYLISVPLQSVGTWITATATTAAGATSEFSNAVRVLAGADSDNDGVSDAEEASGSSARSAGNPAPGDRNGDGTQDAQQAHVASAVWLDGTRTTVVGPNGTTVSRPFTVESPGALPAGICSAGGAVGFTLTGQAGLTTVQVWIPSSIAPSTVWLRSGASWQQVTVLNNTIVGQLRCLDLRATAPGDGEWLFAFGVACPPMPLPQVSVGTPVAVVKSTTSVPAVSAFDTGAPPAALPAPRSTLLPVTVAAPPDAAMRLQSSTDLQSWLDEPRPANPLLPWSFLVGDSARFYRWRRE